MMRELHVKNAEVESTSISMEEFRKSMEERLLYKNILVYGMSQKVLCKTKDVLEKVEDWSEVVEFRCFDESGEVHGVCDASNMILYEIRDKKEESEEDSMLHTISLSNQKDAKEIMIKRYLSYDEDGQVHIVLSRCYDVFWKGGEN